MYLIFDTETTGLPKSYKAPMTDTENWPRCIQIAWQLHNDLGQVIEHDNFMVQPDGLISLLILKKYMVFLQNWRKNKEYLYMKD